MPLQLHHVAARFCRDGLLRLSVLVGGVRLQAIVDSGATASFINKAAVQRHANTLRPRTRANTPLVVYSDGSSGLCSRVVDGQMTLEGPDRPPREWVRLHEVQLPRDVDVVLGLDFLGLTGAVLDFSDGTFRIGEAVWHFRRADEPRPPGQALMDADIRPEGLETTMAQVRQGAEAYVLHVHLEEDAWTARGMHAPEQESAVPLRLHFVRASTGQRAAEIRQYLANVDSAIDAASLPQQDLALLEGLDDEVKAKLTDAEQA